MWRYTQESEEAPPKVYNLSSIQKEMKMKIIYLSISMCGQNITRKKRENIFNCVILFTNSTYLLVFRNYAFQQQFGLSVFGNNCGPIFTTFRDVKLTTTKIV